MTRMLAVAAVTATALAYSLSGEPAPGDAGDPVLFFATRVGDTWTFDRGGEEVVDRVTAVDRQPGVWLVTVAAGNDRGRAHRLAVSRDGVYRVDPDRHPSELWLLKLPARPGETWHNDHVHLTSERQGSSTTVGTEPVVVPAGSFEAVRVDSESACGERVRRRTTWYAARVGPVKHAWADGTVAVLKSFRPGTD